MSILNTFEYCIGYTHGFNSGVLIGAIFLLIGVCWVYYMIKAQDFNTINAVGVFLLIGGLILTPMAWWFSDTITETRYHVTFDKDTPYTEIYENYNILDQDGLIFTVRELPEEQ